MPESVKSSLGHFRYHLPASCFFNWKDFSIFIEDKDAGKARMETHDTCSKVQKYQ